MAMGQIATQQRGFNGFSQNAGAARTAARPARPARFSFSGQELFRVSRPPAMAPPQLLSHPIAAPNFQRVYLFKE